MADILTEQEIARLADLGAAIQRGLACDIDESGVPCRTDRLEVVQLMKTYLWIHGYVVISRA